MADESVFFFLPLLVWRHYEQIIEHKIHLIEIFCSEEDLEYYIKKRTSLDGLKIAQIKIR
ncbi:MAG: hypothetical protein MHPSP_003273, partial [Paramarteilia canceri]